MNHALYLLFTGIFIAVAIGLVTSRTTPHRDTLSDQVQLTSTGVR